MLLAEHVGLIEPTQCHSFSGLGRVSRFSSGDLFGFGGFEARTSRLWVSHPTPTDVMVEIRRHIHHGLDASRSVDPLSQGIPCCDWHLVDLANRPPLLLVEIVLHSICRTEQLEVLRLNLLSASR